MCGQAGPRALACVLLIGAGPSHQAPGVASRSPAPRSAATCDDGETRRRPRFCLADCRWVWSRPPVTQMIDALAFLTVRVDGLSSPEIPLVSNAQINQSRRDRVSS